VGESTELRSSLRSPDSFSISETERELESGALVNRSGFLCSSWTSALLIDE